MHSLIWMSTLAYVYARDAKATRLSALLPTGVTVRTLGGPVTSQARTAVTNGNGWAGATQ
jgi:hypothetical protein